MNVTVHGTPKEIAALVLELQERREVDSFVAETADGPCRSKCKVATGASYKDSPKYPHQDTSKPCL